MAGFGEPTQLSPPNGTTEQEEVIQLSPPDGREDDGVVQLSPPEEEQEQGDGVIQLSPPGSSEPSREEILLGDDSPATQQGRDIRREVDESGDLFGLMDNRDIPKYISAVFSGLEGATRTFVEDIPKTSAAVLETMGGGGIRGELQRAAKRSRERGIPLAEAQQQLTEEEGLLGGLFKAPSQEEIEANPLFKIGELGGKFAEEIFPENPETRDELLSRAAPRMAGQLLAFMGGSAGAARAGGSKLAQTVAGKQRLAAGGMGMTFNATEQFERAKKAGASEEEAFQSFLFGLGTGGLEGLPVAAALKRFDKVTGGTIKKSLSRGLSSNTVKGVFEEGAQEGITQWLNNVGVQNIYDETRNLMDGVWTAVGLGGLAGGTLNAIGTGLSNKLAQAETTQEAAEVAETKDYLRQKVRENELISEEEVDMDLLDPNQPLLKELEQQKASEQTPENQTYTVSPESGTEFLKRKMVNWFSPRGKGLGVLPESALKTLRKQDGAIERELAELENNVRLVETRLKEEFGIEEKGAIRSFFSSTRADEIPDEVYQTINFALTGERPPRVEGGSVFERTPSRISEARVPFETRLRSVPENLQAPVRRMREHVDRLSRQLVDEGIAQGRLKAKIKNNIGFYLTRTYRRNDYENWENYLLEAEDGERIINNAKAYIIESYKKEYGMDPRDPGNDLTTPNRVVEKILNDNKNEFDIFSGSSGSNEGINWNVLTRRKEIAEPIRALMGQRTDGVVNYAQSVEKMANLLESYRFQEEFRDIGLEEGWLHEPGQQVPGAEPVAPENSKIYDPLMDDKGRPYLADREVAKAFEEGYDLLRDNPVLRPFVRINGFAKVSKTALNQGTHLDNVIGATINFMQNGHLPKGEKMRTAARTVSQNLSRKGREDIELLKKANQYNLIGGGGMTGEARDLAQDVVGDAGDSIIDRLTPKAGRSRDHTFGLQSLTRRSAEGVLDIYQASDDFFRLVLWRGEMRDLADVYYDKKLEDLTPDELVNVEQEAADIAKNQFQDYSSVPRVIKFARQAPFTNFLSFQYEMARTSINTIARARQEISSSNPKLRAKGWKRLASAIGAYSGALFKGAAKAGAMMAGISLTKDKMDDLREHMAPWDRGGVLMPVNKEERPFRGPKYTFYNLSQHDPHTWLNGPMRAMARGDDWEEVKRNLGRSIQEQLSPLFSQALMTQALTEAMTGETEYGGRVWHEGSTTGEKTGRALVHVLKTLEPGFLKSGREAAEGIVDINAVDGEVSPSEGILGILGVRATEVDPDKSLDFVINDLKEEVRTQRSEFAGVRAQSTSLDARFDEMEESNRQYRTVFNEASRKIWSAYRLGVPLERIKSKLNEQQISNDVEEQLMRGVPGDIVGLEDILREFEK